MAERLQPWREREIRGWLEVPGSYTLGTGEIRAMLAEIDALRADLKAANEREARLRAGLDEALTVLSDIQFDTIHSSHGFQPSSREYLKNVIQTVEGALAEVPKATA